MFWYEFERAPNPPKIQSEKQTIFKLNKKVLFRFVPYGNLCKVLCAMFSMGAKLAANLWSSAGGGLSSRPGIIFTGLE